MVLHRVYVSQRAGWRGEVGWGPSMRPPPRHPPPIPTPHLLQALSGIRALLKSQPWRGGVTTSTWRKPVRFTPSVQADMGGCLVNLTPRGACHPPLSRLTGGHYMSRDSITLFDRGHVMPRVIMRYPRQDVQAWPPLLSKNPRCIENEAAVVDNYSERGQCGV